MRAAPPGAVFEWRPDTEIMKIATRVRDQDGAALIIDYGHMRSDAGDTFQAIARHSFMYRQTGIGPDDLISFLISNCSGEYSVTTCLK